MCRDLCSKIACCVEAAHNTHPRAMRTSTTPPRRAPPCPLFTLHLHRAVCGRAANLNLSCVARQPLAGGVPWSPTRDHGPCEARAKQLRLSRGDDAHQEEQRARLAVTAFCLLLRILRSRYAASCFAWRGWLRSAKGTYRGNTAAPSSWPSWPRHFCQHLLSCLASVFCVAAQ